MMQSELLALVQNAKAELEAYGERYNVLTEGDIAGMHRVLQLLDAEFRNGHEVNERVLRAFKDVCVMVAIHYEHTTMNDPIFQLNDALTRQITGFIDLPLLRMEFGTGEPI